MPFAIPEKWKWSQLLGIFDVYQPKTISTKELNDDGNYFVYGANGIIGKYTNYNHENSEVVIACRGATCGAVNITKPKSWINGNAMVVRLINNLVCHEYLVAFLKVFNWDQVTSGSAQPQITRKNLSSVLFPVPPIKEQHRIVTKLNQLFEQIDRAEKAYNELSGPLSDRFRQLCLEKAIQGKLVPQLESEPAVEQIGKAPEDVPFTIPEKWKWVCLSNLGKLSTGTTPKTSETGLYGGNFPFIKPGEISEKGDLLPPNQFLTEAGKEQARVVSAGAVLMVCIGTIGKTAIANVALSFNQQINAIDPKGYLIDPIYLHSVFRSSWFQSHVKALASATTIKIVNKNKWGSSYIPLPPLDEQHRIIEKLNELLGTVGQLENTVSVP